MLPLAELPDPASPISIGWVLLAVAGAVGAIGGLFLALNQGAEFLARFRGEKKETSTTEISGQPITVKGAHEYVERRAYDRDREEMRQELARNAAARKTNYERLEQLGCEIAATQAEVTSQGRAIAEVVQVSRETGSKVEKVGGQLEVINQQVQQISNSLIAAAHERRHS